MTDPGITAGEFARLLALPETHPDRMRAEAMPEFAAMKALHAAFEAGGGPELSGSEAREAGAELERRIAIALDAPSGAPAGDVRPGGSAPRAATPDRPRRSGLLDFLRGPTARWGVAFAAVALVAGLGWWMRPGSREGPMRGVEGGDGPALRVARTAGEVRLGWDPVPGADAYRVVFLDPSLSEIMHVESGAAPELVLRADALPAGLAPGRTVLVEIVGLRSGRTLSTTAAQSVRLP